MIFGYEGEHGSLSAKRSILERFAKVRAMSDALAHLTFFDGTTLRRVWHEEEWWYVVVDVVAVLTESPQPQAYWRKQKHRLRQEGADETLQALIQLPVRATDNRLRQADFATTETLLRIMQTIPSPRAEPFRVWLAEVGNERITEIEHPERVLDRVRESYRAKGYDEAWITQRIRADLIRNDLTDEWNDRGANDGYQFAVLTNEISTGTFDLSISAHKRYKVLPPKANLRDHMSPLELALVSLGEATAITFHQTRDSQGFDALHRDAHDAGAAAGEARKVIEARTGQPVVTAQNYLPKPDETKRVAKKTRKQSRSGDTSAGEQQSLFDDATESDPS